LHKLKDGNDGVCERIHECDFWISLKIMHGNEYYLILKRTG